MDTNSNSSYDGEIKSNNHAVDICTNLYYRRDEFHPTDNEISFCKSIIGSRKIRYKDQYEKLLKIAEKYNLI